MEEKLEYGDFEWLKNRFPLDGQIDDNFKPLIELLYSHQFIVTIDYSCSGHISTKESRPEFYSLPGFPERFDREKQAKIIHGYLPFFLDESTEKGRDFIDLVREQCSLYEFASVEGFKVKEEQRNYDYLIDLNTKDISQEINYIGDRAVLEERFDLMLNFWKSLERRVRRDFGVGNVPLRYLIYSKELL